MLLFTGSSQISLHNLITNSHLPYIWDCCLYKVQSTDETCFKLKWTQINHFKESFGVTTIHVYLFCPSGLTYFCISSSSPNLQQPFLEVKVLETTKRSRRNLGLDCDEHSTESRCCRYPLTVDFEAFGWDWIIAPKRYKANYCSGQCEYMFMQKYPHTHLVQHANPRGSAGPCCTPTKMSPINMLYFNDKQQIIHGKIPGMVVDRCGCS